MITPADPAVEVERREAVLRAAFDVAETAAPLELGTVTLLRPANPDVLISEEDYARDERLPYWADLWPSAVVLAKHLEHLEGGGRTLLDLGCGLGLASAVAARAGYDVTSSDYYEDALRFAELNVLRHAGRIPSTWHLDWRDLPEEIERFDAVIASDVLYERQYAFLVAELFHRALAPEGEGWLADPGRLAMGSFLVECARRGLDVERHTEVPFEEGKQRQRITIFRLTHRR
ncbi:MAG TPA: class I SAM-dependent methyltransferase [Gemmatimonadales bacterium]